MKQVSYLILFLLTIYTTSVFSHTDSCSVSREQPASTVVVFGNGIMGNKKDAQDSMERMEELLRATLSPGEFSKLEFDLAYNKSYGFMKDLYEAAKQKLGSDNAIISFWRWMGDWSIMPDVLQDSATDLAVKFDFSAQVATEDLAKHIALYRTSIAEGKSVQLNCHSQGCFFANSSYSNLFEGSNAISNIESFGIVAVATPASYVAGGGPHTTLVEDAVIAAISIATPKGILPPLYPNITNLFSGAEASDFKGHSYFDEYMAGGSRSVGKIVNDSVSGISTLQQPIATVEDGVITITASWDDPFGTQRMFVLEQNVTTVVDENNPNGVYGNLTTNTVGGVTTQKYIVPCETIGDTLYQAQVFDFKNLPNTVFVKVEAGPVVREYTIEFSESDGPTARALPVANVTVSQNADGTHKFKVIDVNKKSSVPDFKVGEF